jgi:hypothetical protein
VASAASKIRPYQPDAPGGTTPPPAFDPSDVARLFVYPLDLVRGHAANSDMRAEGVDCELRLTLRMRCRADWITGPLADCRGAVEAQLAEVADAYAREHGPRLWALDRQVKACDAAAWEAKSAPAEALAAVKGAFLAGTDAAPARSAYRLAMGERELRLAEAEAARQALREARDDYARGLEALLRQRADEIWRRADAEARAAEGPLLDALSRLVLPFVVAAETRNLARPPRGATLGLVKNALDHAAQTMPPVPPLKDGPPGGWSDSRPFQPLPAGVELRPGDVRLPMGMH